MPKKKPHQTHLEHHIKNILSPFQAYIFHQRTTGILLITAALVAIILASTPAFKHVYDALINTKMGVHFDKHLFSEPIKFWVNDVLLTVFFFFVGLEIKREFLVGELKNPKVANYVIFSAIGGMIFPAGIYYLINHGTPSQHGWGIPMATDTAFAIGLLMFFKNKVPNSLFIFLASLAIIDDIGAITVIAVFYTDHFNLLMFCYALISFGVLGLINYIGVRSAIPYLFIGIILWVCIENAGIHGTIAGILVAMMIPARPNKAQKAFIASARKHMNDLEKRIKKNKHVLEDEKQHDALVNMEKLAKETTTPLQRIYSKIELYISLGILPLFALTNAGVQLNMSLFHQIALSRISWGIMLGLVVGKPVGVLLLGKLSRALNISERPKDCNHLLLLGSAALTGIGFTMSLFVGILTFSHSTNSLSIMKMSVMLASLISGIIGCTALHIATKEKNTQKSSEGK